MIIIKESTQLFYQRRWDIFIDWLGDRLITSEVIDQYVDFMTEKGYSASHINAFISTAAYYVPDYIELPTSIKKERKEPLKSPLTRTELRCFETGIPTLKESQQTDINLLLQGLPTKRYYSSIYFLVQKVSLLTIGRAISPSQVKGLKAL